MSGDRFYKCYPAFGKQILNIRLSGKVPANLVMATFNWNIARAYPRIIIDDKTPFDALEFCYLSGIPCQIVYGDKDAHRVARLVQVILKAVPSFLSTFGLDLVDTCEATTIIKPLQNTQTEEALCV